MAWLNATTAVLAGFVLSLMLPADARAVTVSPAPAQEEPADDNASAEAAEADREGAQKALCKAIETAATDHDLPVGFFTRLIWKESRFRSDAVSPKGALGIAQFMPATAAERGLQDPFDAATALPASASFLADLNARFGNLGLAAAAYNAGPERVANWLAESATLPFETQDFVLTITGLPAATWADPEGEPALPEESEDARGCLALAALLRGPGAPLAPDLETGWGPWGVQVAGHFSRAKAVAAFAALGQRFPDLVGGRPPMIVSGRVPGRGTRSFYRVRIPAETRAEAETLCTKLKASGGECIVLKS